MSHETPEYRADEFGHDDGPGHYDSHDGHDGHDDGPIGYDDAGAAWVEADDRSTLAIAAGLCAAIIAGIGWAFLVRVTGYEVGYAAWGVGLLVGWAMTQVTVNRSRSLANTAATLAVAGLIVGKLAIFMGSSGSLTDLFMENDDALRGSVAWQMYENRELDSATLEELDAALAAGDTLSDEVWDRMMDQAGAHLAGVDDATRRAMAQQSAKLTLARIGPVQGIISQFTLFDLLWVALAVGTAYRMLLPAPQPEPIEPQTA